MKRDMNLVRSILIASADSDNPLSAGAFVDNERDIDAVIYHIKIMYDAGLIEASFKKSWEKPIADATVISPTWEGNDFLDAVRNEKVWKKVSLKIAQMAGTATFDIIKSLAVKELSTILL